MAHQLRILAIPPDDLSRFPVQHGDTQYSITLIPRGTFLASTDTRHARMHRHACRPNTQTNIKEKKIRNKHEIFLWPHFRQWLLYDSHWGHRMEEHHHGLHTCYPDMSWCSHSQTLGSRLSPNSHQVWALRSTFRTLYPALTAPAPPLLNFLFPKPQNRSFFFLLGKRAKVLL